MKFHNTGPGNCGSSILENFRFPGVSGWSTVAILPVKEATELLLAGARLEWSCGGSGRLTGMRRSGDDHVLGDIVSCIGSDWSSVFDGLTTAGCKISSCTVRSTSPSLEIRSPSGGPVLDTGSLVLWGPSSFSTSTFRLFAFSFACWTKLE